MKVNIGSMLAKRSFLIPEKEAFIDVGHKNRLTYCQYNANANRAANALKQLGIQKGDRVALLMMNSAVYMELFFGIAKIGAICVPLNWRLTAEELTYILRDSEATSLVYDDEFKKIVSEIHSSGSSSSSVVNWIHSVAGDTDVFAENLGNLYLHSSDTEPSVEAFDDDPLFIMYTSGTTGQPKGAVHTHNTVLWAAINMDSTWELRHEDRFFVPLPLFHVGALMPTIMAVYTGITVIALRTFDPSLAWKTIEMEKVTNSLMVPTIIQFMLQVPEKDTCDFLSFRWASIAGAPVPVSLLEACGKIGIHLEQLFGLTEACGPGCQLVGKDVASKLGSAGKPFLFLEARVVDKKDKEVDPNTPGELILRGKNIMLEYWNRPNETEATLRNGWLHTGDVATMDEDGFIYIVDRIKDMIISGGENIYPAELEKVISAMPQVRQVAVIGKSDEKWGEVPMAVVEKADESLDEHGLISFCEGKLARYKIPKAVIFVDSLPMTATGKVQKRVMKKNLRIE